ncbi:MAG TPA: winged helix-turn-helix domain-containing protein [Coriobacteriia bacterium]
MAVERSGDDLLKMLGALANPHRLRIVAALSRRTRYVSELARELNMSRPLLHMHLQRLEAAGLVVGHHEVSSEGRALRYFEVTDFDERLSSTRIAAAAATLSTAGSGDEKEI